MRRNRQESPWQRQSQQEKIAATWPAGENFRQEGLPERQQQNSKRLLESLQRATLGTGQLTWYNIAYMRSINKIYICTLLNVCMLGHSRLTPVRCTTSVYPKIGYTKIEKVDFPNRKNQNCIASSSVFWGITIVWPAQYYPPKHFGALQPAGGISKQLSIVVASRLGCFPVRFSWPPTATILSCLLNRCGWYT